MSPPTRTDWTPTKEAELSYWEKMVSLMLKLQDKLVGQSLNLAYESCGYVMEKQNQWKIKQDQAEKMHKCYWW